MGIILRLTDILENVRNYRAKQLVDVNSKKNRVQRNRTRQVKIWL
jgi:hypothetical protein